MDTKTIIDLASHHLKGLPGRSFDIFNLSKPADIEEAVSMAKLYKIVSKVSPLVGNLIEHDTVDFLNEFEDYESFGKWIRQDPGFPDVILNGIIQPQPGFEIKAWYPFSTEITGRFKDSQNHFSHDQTYVILLAWLPEYLIYGKPLLLDILITSGRTVAEARDNHYHNPPDYLVLEPEDTSKRSQNLQQTNTNGYKFQSGQDEFSKAQKIVQSWGDDIQTYQPTSKYQAQLRQLTKSFKYRLDTNYAKMDRIAHQDIEAFKSRVLVKEFHGMKISEWFKILSKGSDEKIKEALINNLGIKRVPDF